MFVCIPFNIVYVFIVYVYLYIVIIKVYLNTYIQNSIDNVKIISNSVSIDEYI